VRATVAIHAMVARTPAGEETMRTQAEKIAAVRAWLDRASGS